MVIIRNEWKREGLHGVRNEIEMQDLRKGRGTCLKHTVAK
jgi:hypothetical protein